MIRQQREEGLVIMLDRIWVEKYRPEKLDDVVGQNEIIRRLKSYVQTYSIPHLLFSGPPGVGKSASATSLARELFGDLWRLNFSEFNASDERGIDTVREKIKNIARSSTIGDFPYKLIFLDEADSLTSEAQSALRRTMENYTDICRFILSCNYPSKIIEPIQSRCAVYRFRPLLNKYIAERINYIVEKEKINLTNDGLNAIVYVADGDMRRAINALQGSASVDKNIDRDSIYQTTSTAKPEDILELVTLSLRGEFFKAKSKLEFLIHDQGFSGEDITKQMYKVIFDTTTISDKMKIKMLDYLGEIDFRLSEGANQYIQISSLLCRYMSYGGGG